MEEDNNQCLAERGDDSLKGTAVANNSASLHELSDQAKGNDDELIAFRIVWKKKPFDVEFKMDQTIGYVKKHMEKLTGNFAHVNGLLYTFVIIERIVSTWISRTTVILEVHGIDQAIESML